MGSMIGVLLLKWLLVFLLLLIVLFVVLGYARTWTVEHSSEAGEFRAGTLPSSAPEGLYKGSVRGYQASWLGKKFDAASKTGINIFAAGGGATREQYPFVTSVGTDELDAAISVVRIDYDTPQNPFWLRPILDEIVEVAPGTYLGKLLVRIIPGHPFAFTYFRLQK